MPKYGLPRMKIGKDEVVYFDGELISECHWICPKDRVDLSDGVLRGLVNAGVKFSRKFSGGLATGDDAMLPDLKKLATPPDASLAREFWVSELASRFQEGGWVRLLVEVEGDKPTGKLVGIRDCFFELVGSCRVGVLAPEKPCWFKVGEGEADWVAIMPVWNNGLKEDIRMLAETLSTPDRAAGGER